MMFSLACRWSSLTHDLALSSEAWTNPLADERRDYLQQGASYSLGNVVDDYGAIGVPIVHGSQALVSLLSRCIPDLELDGGVVVEGYCLREESSADCGFAVVIELVLYHRQAWYGPIRPHPHVP